MVLCIEPWVSHVPDTCSCLLTTSLCPGAVFIKFRLLEGGHSACALELDHLYTRISGQSSLRNGLSSLCCETQWPGVRRTVVFTNMAIIDWVILSPLCWGRWQTLSPGFRFTVSSCRVKPTSCWQWYPMHWGLVNTVFLPTCSACWFPDRENTPNPYSFGPNQSCLISWFFFFF